MKHWKWQILILLLLLIFVQGCSKSKKPDKKSYVESAKDAVLFNKDEEFIRQSLERAKLEKEAEEAGFIGKAAKVLPSFSPCLGNLSVVFYEPFNDFSNWSLYGDPKPTIKNGAFLSNGDGWCQSEAVTKNVFNFFHGGAVEFRAKTTTFSQHHYMNVMCFLTNELVQGDCAEENWVPKIGIWIAPPNEAAGPGIHVIYPGHKSGEVVYPYPGDGWHTYRFEFCSSNGNVRFYIDGKMFFKDHVPTLIDLPPWWPVRICVSGRSLYGDNLIDDVKVMLPTS